MTCSVLYASEYISGCDISKYGEGCEKCVPLFKSDLILPICITGGIVIILSIILLYLKRKEMK
jgi:hypothetical protein